MYNTNLLNFVENKLDYKKSWYERRMLFERSMHELDKMKRSQVQQVDEMSIHNLRENHETIHQLTSQLQQLQEQMNSMNSSGEFQDTESNYSGRLFHVSSLARNWA